MQNASITDGYPTLIDVPSFVDFMLINELAANVDGYQISTFFHKDRNGKLRAGPVWDFNLTYGNDLFFWGYDRSHTDTWQFDNGDNTGSAFWKDLYDNPEFKCSLVRRWNELTAADNALNYSVILNTIDSLEILVGEAKDREEQRWGTVGNHEEQVQAIRSWLQLRFTWLNENLISAEPCPEPELPNLVISKIHYNPLATAGNTSDELEFIEITNNGLSPVNLTGFYLRELGITYLFPVDSEVQAGEVIYLASNSAAFSTEYGFEAFGQYTRTLSNKTQALLLADAFGNTIDFVQYADAAPWAVEADGTGPYLQLVDLNSDNSLAASWTISSVALTPYLNAEQSPILYPNPAQNVLYLKNYPQNSVISLTDISGKTLDVRKISNTSVDIQNLNKGIYVLKISTPTQFFTLKFVKN